MKLLVTMVIKIRTAFLLVLLACTGKVNAQIGFERILQEIDTNNLTLKALRQKLESERIAARIGLYPSNPQAEVIYQWGNPVDIGNRTTIGITQQFDFPTAYIYKAKLAKGMSTALEHEFRAKRAEILNNASLLCAELVYHNALVMELQRQQESAMVIANSLKQKYDAGVAGILPYTQAELVYQELNSRISQAILQRKILSDELTALNGSVQVHISDTAILLPELPPNFETYFSAIELQNPELAYLKSEVENSHTKLQLVKSEKLPSFTVGYASEKLVGERFQGIVVGMSIPLWEKINTISHARANERFVQLLTHEYLINYRLGSERLFNKAVALRELIDQLTESIDRLNIVDKLNLALDKGEISIIDYYTELNNYNSIKERLLEVQYEYLKTYIELHRFTSF